MIGYVKGIVTGVLSDSVLLENHGVGYHIYTSMNALTAISGTKDEVKMFTHLHVREDEISLFGFPTMEELSTFNLLLTVNGIGPKAALSILSVLSVKDLSLAILSGDVKAITKANGIGTKGANRIIMELKDKMDYEDALGVNEPVATVSGNIQSDKSAVSDATLALVSLGYSESEALKAISQVADANQLDSEALLKQALKKLF